MESIKNILKKKEVSEIDKKYKDDTSNLLMKPTFINDILLSFPEFKRNEQKNVIICELCVDKSEIEQLNENEMI